MSELEQGPAEATLTATEVDSRVGDRVRRRRILMGLTQDQLGEALGISYQQIQKYETGANRVSVGRLYLIAQKLGVNPGWFFDGSLSDASRDDIDDLGSSRLLMDFVRNFSRIEDERLRTAIVALVRAMADAEDTGATNEALSTLNQNGELRPEA
ncbi:MAG: helix-turn-helix transcriptional regulator [Pseudomonadota bacterium]